VETHVRAEHVRDEIDHGRILRERPQLGMLIHGLAQAADVRLFGAVIRRQVELIVGGRSARDSSTLAATTARSRSSHAAPT
jgi:hypothetical protein